MSLHARRAFLRYCGLVSVLGLGGWLRNREMSNANAKERALTAEERYLRDRLGNATCVEQWSLTSFVGLEQSATVTNRTSEGVTVEVSHPYSYSSTDGEADVETEAHYVVTPNETRRVGGTEVNPCQATAD